MQTVTFTARVQVTQRFTAVYYGQATFKMGIFIYFIQIDQVCYLNVTCSFYFL